MRAERFSDGDHDGAVTPLPGAWVDWRHPLEVMRREVAPLDGAVRWLGEGLLQAATACAPDCHWCDGATRVAPLHRDDIRHHAQVRCDGCGARGPECSSFTAAIAAFARR